MPEPMDKVINNLWIGSLAAALDADLLHENGIKSILSAMRGRFAINKTFHRHQIPLDDTDDADALVHFMACIDWIDSQLRKGRGVLVHCQAGMSRSATIVAAFLMYTYQLDVQSALDLIRKARPVIQPNENFVAQLALFHNAHYKRTPKNKETRAFYVERAVKEVLNGDGSALEIDMFAKYPRTPTDSVPTTPSPKPRRRLRCKMCRQELATREHMVDHGQVGPATPAGNHVLSPAASRRPSAGEGIAMAGRGTSPADQVAVTSRPPRTTEVIRKLSFGTAVGGMTPIDAPESASTPVPSETVASNKERRLSGSEAVTQRHRSSVSGPIGGLSMTPIAHTCVDSPESWPVDRGSASSKTKPRRRSLLGLGDGDVAKVIDGLSMSAIESDEEDEDGPGQAAEDNKHGSTIEPSTAPVTGARPSLPPLCSPQELAARIHPNLAALRNSPLISALSSSGSLDAVPLKDGLAGGKQLSTRNADHASPPLLMPNMKCSGYFVEPMNWMEPFLESGDIAGKIACPNKKCGAKLGNYDWAGVECSCKEWVIPGFCIHRSKVDEVVI